MTLTNQLGLCVAGIAAFLMYNEIPGKSFYLASAFILAGLLIAVLKQERNHA